MSVQFLPRKTFIRRSAVFRATGLFAAISLGAMLPAQHVTFAPYIQLGDNGPLGATDQVVVAWQTDEPTPNGSPYSVEFGLTTSYGKAAAINGRVVDNYLTADPTLPKSPTTYGAHSNYVAILSGLSFDTTYFYRVSGPGLPSGGFVASFHTRKTTPVFSFAVEGDEGFFPVNPNVTGTANIVNYEARITHLIYNAGNIPVPGSASRPPAEFVLNTGDNVYNVGSEGPYRDFFFPVFNNDKDSNETGAPLIRSSLYFITVGNHDLGSTGVSANLLADNSAPRFSGNVDGGDALAHFNNFYYPQNGPTGFDIQNTWNVDSSIQNGMTFSYMGQNYNSPAAIEAYRASTTVDTGKGANRQIDHQSNYSFDYGNAHFLFLDSNPHLFNGNLPGGVASTTPPPPPFTAYPTPLGKWVINDLDSSKQTWKIVVYHQPAFSSGDATILNNQMRAVAKLLEDHGVNMVFNGHEHNYQRSLPIRATARTAGTPSTMAGSPAVMVDTAFDGNTQTVPDGVLYLVEGAGGNRDFDANQAPPRGSGTGVDQDDSATGVSTPMAGLTVPQGPGDWLDTNLTNREMVTNFPNAGTGQKITKLFKSKIYSFGHVLVDNNSFMLYQITEPLLATSSATAGTPAPYGRDYAGQRLDDPIPDTVLDSTTGVLVSPAATGASALLDKFTVTKPDVSSGVTAQLSAPPSAAPGGALVFTIVAANHGAIALNGTQVHVTLSAGLTFAGTTSETLTVQGSDVVVTLGRLAPGNQQIVQIKTRVAANASAGSAIAVNGSLVSGTALPVALNSTTTKVVSVPGLPALP
jgi:uncharacterized repeat protein (TIGR01451 family)